MNWQAVVAFFATVWAEAKKAFPYLAGMWMEGLRREANLKEAEAQTTKESYRAYEKYRSMPDDERDAEWLRRGEARKLHQ